MTDFLVDFIGYYHDYTILFLDYNQESQLLVLCYSTSIQSILHGQKQRVKSSDVCLSTCKKGRFYLAYIQEEKNRVSTILHIFKE